MQSTLPPSHVNNATSGLIGFAFILATSASKDGVHETHPLGVACVKFVLRLVGCRFVANLGAVMRFVYMIIRTFMGYGDIPMGCRV
jgi:hypothetical protein